MTTPKILSARESGYSWFETASAIRGPGGDGALLTPVAYCSGGAHIQFTWQVAIPVMLTGAQASFVAAYPSRAFTSGVPCVTMLKWRKPVGAPSAAPFKTLYIEDFLITYGPNLVGTAPTQASGAIDLKIYRNNGLGASNLDPFGAFWRAATPMAFPTTNVDGTIDGEFVSTAAGRASRLLGADLGSDYLQMSLLNDSGVSTTAGVLKFTMLAREI